MTEKMQEINVTSTTEEIYNMTVEHWHVSKESIELIKKCITLDSDYLLDQVNAMIDRTPGYMELPQEEQQQKVKIVLDCEAALAYLEQSELIQSNCVMAEFQYDHEHEDVLIDVFYVTEDEAVNQALNFYNMTKEEAENLETAVNIFNQDDSLVEQAKKKLEKINKNKEKYFAVERAKQRVKAAQAEAARKQAAKSSKSPKVVPFKRRSN